MKAKKEKGQKYKLKKETLLATLKGYIIVSCSTVLALISTFYFMAKVFAIKIISKSIWLNSHINTLL